jgi:hypothetical protein
MIERAAARTWRKTSVDDLPPADRSPWTIWKGRVRAITPETSGGAFILIDTPYTSLRSNIRSQTAAGIALSDGAANWAIITPHAA